MEILLIRHTSVNIDKDICYGFSDVDLSSDFQFELNLIKSKLNGIKDYTFYSSPLSRCSILAESLSNSNYAVDNRLKEMNFGEWELTSWNDINESDLQQWIEEFVNFKCPDGESFIELYDRAVNFYLELLKREHKKVAIITHGGVIRSIIAHLLDIPLKNAPILQIDFGSISKIQIAPEYTRLVYINK